MSTQYKIILGIETLGNPRAHLGQPKSFPFCISIGELDIGRDFFPVRLVRTHCKRNYFILQYTITVFLVGESFGGMFKCCSMDVVEGELFHFQPLFINREIILTY